jgi:hypothetical protein
MHVSEIQAIRHTIDAIIRARPHGVFARLDETTHAQLVDTLTYEAGAALEGLHGAWRVGAKPVAWNLDVFYKGVSDALARAGVPTTPNPDSELSYAQALARDIAAAIELPGNGGTSFYLQAQRAQAITRDPARPDDELARAWLDGKLVARHET